MALGRGVHSRPFRAGTRCRLAYVVGPAMTASAASSIDDSSATVPPKRMRAILAYDGRPHSGWQFVGNGKSVQEAVERAVGRLLKIGRRVPVHSSGRTDAGVHALGQVVHFDVPATCRMDGGAWRRALNSLLPPSIRVLEVRPAEEGFHARYSATGKHYRFHLFTGPILPPHEFGLVWQWPWPLDAEAMTAAAARFRGEHDFSAFAAFRHDGTDQDAGTGKNVRRVWRADVIANGPRLVFDFEGSGFLYRMVRMMVGALIHVGRGTLAASGIDLLLECRCKEDGRLIKSPLCADGDGLYLVEVFYETRPSANIWA